MHNYNFDKVYDLEEFKKLFLQENMTMDIDMRQKFDENILFESGELELNSNLSRNISLIDAICISIRKLRETNS
jgi:hypothetical protein